MKKILFLSIILLWGCSSSNENEFKFLEQGREVPVFSSDSAYHFIQAQLSFGPRVPNSEAHQTTLNYLEKKLKEYAGENGVYIQKFKERGYNEELQLGNIIAAFNTSSSNRIMLCAHWDTRPRADKDSANAEKPIPGADDGASGVAVLLELARIMNENPPPIGVDIILFDGEDYGTSGDLSKYFLGSRYWSQNPPVSGYSPKFGILLDMVGAEKAQFPKEEYSAYYAPGLQNGLWNLAGDLGYEHLFLQEKGAAVSDDHVIVNEQTNIRVVNIINHSRSASGSAEFAPHWHTHQDDIDIISKETLQAVGHVLTELIYNRIKQ